MILYIVESKKREPLILNSLNKNFFSSENKTIITYCNDIYEFYKEIDEYKIAEGDFRSILIQILRENKSSDDKNNAEKLKDIKMSDIAEIYLFFDYDIHQKQNTNSLNEQLKELLNFFTDETTKGKLFISYPMVEAIRYTKELPDNDFCQYQCEISDFSNFKKKSAVFSFYKNLQFLNDKQNRLYLNEQNVKKANYICSGQNSIPKNADCIKQTDIFDNQLEKFVNLQNEISILSAFPLFLFDYFGNSSKILP